MKSLVFLLLVVDIILIKGNASDPCHDYSELPRKDYRYHEFKVNDKTYDHDYYLEEGWYRAGDLTIPDTPPPDFNRCGTSVPIWMQGAHPSPEDGIVERTACTISLFDWCAFGYNIKVKNCGTYFVYYLLPTTTRIEGYCFGVDAPHHEHEILDFVPKRPKLIAEPERHYRGRTTYSMVHFKCQFDLPKTNEKYYYRIEWIASDFGKPQRRFNVSKAVQADKLKTLELTEALFSRHKLHMGMNLACRVYVHLRFDVQDGTVSERSESLHLGIHVNVRDTVVQRGKKGRIEFKPTVPIGCPGEGPCRIYVEAFVPKECDVAPEFDTFCGVCLQSDSWNDTYTATFTPHASLEYEKSGIYDVHFKITNAVYGSMWSSYALPPVAITVEKGGDTWKGKKCSSNNDPHMTTFDGRKYELHKPGTYVLYKHKRHDAEVQIKLSPCSGYRPDVQCNCGVAVRAGNEVFVIDKCEDTNAVFGFKSKACNGDAIFPRRISESTYWIVFVYGTYVEVNIGSASSKYINVQVVPSVHDQDSSSTGLCGQLNGNTMDDFVLQSGKISEETRDPTCLSTRWYSCFPNDFTQDWKVSVKKSLFVFGEVLERSLQPWPTYVCVCPEHRKEADLATEICDSTAKCLTGNKVAQTTCNRLKRRKRDIRWHERFPRKARKTERRSLVKREVTYDTWSEESATKFCNEYLNKSPVFGLCGDVPNARPQLSLETCIIDIILQQTTVWSDNSVNMMQGSCINEITRNNTLREEPSKNETQPNLAETIQANTCPGLCSGRGECDNGTCICEPGFGFDDCSLDISEPPEIFGITDDGLCDEREEHCLEAMVHGETFTEIGELICNIRPFLMPHGSSRRSYKASSRVKGQLDTLYEIFCPVNGIEIYDTHVDPLAPRKSSVVGFTISVSNDGVHFGEEVDLYLYDSACLLPTKNTDERYEFVLENNFCLINRRCFADGELCGTDPCLICDMQHNQYNWTERAPEDCIPTTTNPTTTSTASITPSGDDYYEYYDYYAPSEIDPTYIDSESLSTETTSTTKTTSKTPTTITTSSNSTTTATSTTPITTTTTTTPTTASSSTIPTTTTTSTTPTTTITSTTHTTTTTSTTPTTTTPTSTTTSAIPTTTTASTTPTTTTTSTTPTTTITSATPTTTTASTTPTTTTTSTTPTTTITSTTPTTTTTSTTPTTTITSTTRTTSKTSTIPTTTTTNSAPTTSIATPTILITSTIPTTTTRITTSTTTRASSASSTKSTAPATTTKSTASSSTTASKTHSYTTTNSTSTYSTVASTVTARSTVKPQTTILSDDTIIASVSGIVGVLVLCVVSIFLFRLCAKRKKS